MNRIIVEDAAFLRHELDSKLAQFTSIFILGCTGMLGSYFTKVLSHHCASKKTPSTIFGVARFFPEESEYIETNYAQVFKLIDYREFPKLLKKSGETLVIHCASPSSTQEIFRDPVGAAFTNLELTSIVAKQLSQSGGHITFLSSGEVYGDSAPTPTKENDYSPFDHLSSRGAYPELKKSAEVILDSYTRMYPKISATSLRVFHTFGPGLRLEDPRIFGIVCKSIIQKSEINLHSDGSTVRTFMYSRDLLKAVLATIGIPKFQVFNVAGSQGTSILEFCNLSLKLGVPKVNLNVSTDSVPRNLQVGLADTSKLRGLGWSPEVSTIEALKRTVQSMVD